MCSRYVNARRRLSNGASRLVSRHFSNGIFLVAVPPASSPTPFTLLHPTPVLFHLNDASCRWQPEASAFVIGFEVKKRVRMFYGLLCIPSNETDRWPIISRRRIFFDILLFHCIWFLSWPNHNFELAIPWPCRECTRYDFSWLSSFQVGFTWLRLYLIRAASGGWDEHEAATNWLFTLRSSRIYKYVPSNSSVTNWLVRANISPSLSIVSYLYLHITARRSSRLCLSRYFEGDRYSFITLLSSSMLYSYFFWRKKKEEKEGKNKRTRSSIFQWHERPHA